MVTTKQSAIRFRDEDTAILEEVRRRTGLSSLSEAVRFVIHQYAAATKIVIKTKGKKK